MSRSADEIPAIKPNVIRAVAVASAMCPFAGKTSKKKPRPAVVAHASPNTIPRNALGKASSIAKTRRGASGNLRYDQSACAKGKNARQVTIRIFCQSPIPTHASICVARPTGAMQVRESNALENFGELILNINSIMGTASNVASAIPPLTSTSET